MSAPTVKEFELPFPFGGVHESSGVDGQPEGTSPQAVNVRGYDAVARRDRGSQRPGHVKAVASNQTGEAIDLLCVGYIGRVHWVISSGSGSGADYTANPGFKLERHGASAVLTVQSAGGGDPGDLAAGNTTFSFVHPAAASPNGDDLGGGEYEYDLGPSVFDDNGAAGDGAADRTLTLIGMPFGVVTMKQAGELTYEEAFAYPDGNLHSVSAGKWLDINGSPFPSPATSSIVQSGQLTFPATGAIACAGKSLGDAVGTADNPTYADTGSLVFSGLTFVDPAQGSQWSSVTTGFQLPGTGAVGKISFQMDASAVAYVAGALKGLFDGIGRKFVYHCTLLFHYATNKEASLFIQFNSFTNTWRYSGNAGASWTNNGTVLKLDGTTNLFAATGAGTARTLSLNGVNISTLTLVAPSSVRTDILSGTAMLDAGGNVDNTGTVPVGAVFRHPLIVSDVAFSGDKPASSL